MTLDQLLALLSMIALACVGGTAGARIVALARARVWVLPIDRKRSLPEALSDLVAVFVMAAFVWEAVMTAVAPGWRILGLPRVPLDLPWVVLRVLGVPGSAAAVALYVLALRDLGLSWRFTIDRERPGELVTHGVFARTRNPIYIALMLLAAGVALMLGSPLLITLACACPLYFDALVRREEAFLVCHYGQAYQEYRARTPRWLR
jgi:protein-S-isoprenylcysteine O-methyltransferase Ste14